MSRAVIPLVLATVAALAAPAPPAAADTRDEAEQFYRIGEKAYKKQNYKEAAKDFEEAYARAPLPDIAFAAAQAQRLQYYLDRKLERLRRAVELYRIYVDAMHGEGGRVGDASQSLAELEPMLRELGGSTATGGTGTGTATAPLDGDRPTAIVVSVEPGDAKELAITVDGAAATALDTVAVGAGDHEVNVTAKGYQPYTKKVIAIDHETRPVEIELVPQRAVVAVDGARGADLAIDGAIVGRLPVRPVELPAGDHVIAVTRRGHRAWSREVALARGQHLTLAPELHTTTQRSVSRYLMVAGGASALGSIICGVVAVKAGHDARALDDKRMNGSITEAEREHYDRLVSDRDDYRSAALIFGGIAIIAGATAAVTYYFDTPQAGAPVTPMVTPEGGGIAVSGEF